ncbi:MAG: two-component system, OmpR family, copper resistance phosphate regulon response regulator CusR, partial [Gaiellales bacterium]|nr:two-component system, OmpR family, copper resistance phosphate regulon response regulator CusR [Gaiellales bacterium]
MRLLIVEDENLIARFVARGLQAEGYTTGVASDGETALQRLHEEEWDLVILDL